MMNVPSFVRIHVLPPFRTNGPNKPDIVLAINGDGCWRDNNHLVVTGRQMGLSMYVKSALDQVSYDPASVWKSRTPKCRWAAELQLCTHIVDGRYFAGITTIDKIDELVDESRCDIAKDNRYPR